MHVPETLELALIAYALLGSFTWGWLIVRLYNLEERVQKHKIIYSYALGIGITILGYALGRILEITAGAANGFTPGLGLAIGLTVLGGLTKNILAGKNIILKSEKGIPEKSKMKFGFEPEMDIGQKKADALRGTEPREMNKERIKQIILEKAKMASETERRQKEQERWQRMEERKKIRERENEMEISHEIPAERKMETRGLEISKTKIPEERKEKYPEKYEENIESERTQSERELKERLNVKAEKTIQEKKKVPLLEKPKVEQPEPVRAFQKVKQEAMERQANEPIPEISGPRITGGGETQKEEILKKLKDKLSQLKEENMESGKLEEKLLQAHEEKKAGGQQKPWEQVKDMSGEQPELSEEEKERAKYLKAKKSVLDELKQEVGITVERKKSGLEEVTIAEDVTQRIERKLEEEKQKEQEQQTLEQAKKGKEKGGLFRFLKKKEPKK